ncbi:helix-turn-helix domain-containing protein [Nocardia araoensis]|uniref:helix-turn-helix domain-containing protein n=1 Tax=Nocardia araoensis TaxID=228600 RepID=UPI000A30CA85|nr:helix-turn-helix domain-containing protein [Nocardia araoensis]
MAEKKNPLGATGETVAANVQKMREQSNLSYAELSRRLQAIGRTIPTLGLRKIESRERRIDADDLVALAAALEVSPLTLLMPESADRSDQVRTTAHSDTAVRIFQWLRGDALPGAYDDPQRQFSFMIRSRPKWAVSEAITRQTGSTDGDD